LLLRLIFPPRSFCHGNCCHMSYNHLPIRHNLARLSSQFNSVSHSFLFFSFSLNSSFCLISRSALRHDAGCWKISAKGYDFAWHRFSWGLSRQADCQLRAGFLMRVSACRRQLVYKGVRLENGIYGHSRFCNTDFDDKLACLNLSGV
jgi:hypothetical protein